VQIAKRLPTLDIALGDELPHVRGKIREYVSEPGLGVENCGSTLRL
jgi:hypothetical protein